MKIMLNEDRRDVEDAVPYREKNRLEQTSYIEDNVEWRQTGRQHLVPRRASQGRRPLQEKRTEWGRLRLLKIMLNEGRRDVEDAVPYKFVVLRKDAVPYQ